MKKFTAIAYTDQVEEDGCDTSSVWMLAINYTAALEKAIEHYDSHFAIIVVPGHLCRKEVARAVHDAEMNIN
jgi:hypothetical protein